MVKEGSPEWARVWALRDSRLPARIRFWDARTVESTDFLFSYGDDQPPEFYDPEPYREVLRASSDDAALPYALLKDPGGRPLSPADLPAASEKAR